MQEFYLYNEELFTYEALCERIRERFDSPDEIMEYAFPDLSSDCCLLWEYFTNETKIEFLDRAVEEVIKYEAKVYMLNE